MTKVKFEDDPLPSLIKRGYLNENEAKSYQEAYSFLLRVRNELHFRSKRPVDILHLEKQPEVALGLGYNDEDIFPRVEKFMGDFYACEYNSSTVLFLEQRLIRATSGSTASLSFRSVLSAYRASPVEKVDGFDLQDGELSSENEHIFDEDPERIIRLFRHSQRLSAKLSPSLRSLVRNRLSLIDASLINCPAANVSFRSILQEIGNVAPTLMEMHDLGVLGDLYQSLED